MPTVNLTAGEWNFLLALINTHDGVFVDTLMDNINAQLDGQEY